MRSLLYIIIGGTLLLSSCGLKPGNESSAPYEANRLLTEEEMLSDPDILSGVYHAYPGPEQQTLTPAPEGYEAFYISHYGRHGSRYQPSNARYENTLNTLLQGREAGILTEFGESLLPRIQLLCDSCLDHGGQLTVVGARQHYEIAQRMYDRFPEVFGRQISARASVVPRCGASMRAFCQGLEDRSVASSAIHQEIDSAYMAYIAYDTPAMKELNNKTAPWQEEYRQYMLEQLGEMKEEILSKIFADASAVDATQFIPELYWLVVGMQNLDVPGCDLSDIFTPQQLLQAWKSVNYRMYVCNGNASISNGIPAASASTLLQNIVESADSAIASDAVSATLRFGHDTNLLRLLNLMRVHNCSNSVEDPREAWKIWQENRLSPMGANLQMIFYRNAEGDVLVKTLHNENEVLYDIDLQPVSAPYYRWADLKVFFQSQIVLDNEQTEFVESIQ